MIRNAKNLYNSFLSGSVNDRTLKIKHKAMDSMDVEDNNAFCEKIVNEIYAVFLKDPEL